MQINPDLFARAIPCTGAIATQWAPFFIVNMARYDIGDTREQAGFLAHVGHESVSMQRLRESMNYSADRLQDVFGAHRITREQAEQFGRTDLHPADQVQLANVLYGGEWGREHLGNTEPDDGWDYRGAGPLQHTGRDNMRELTNAGRVVFGTRCPDFTATPQALMLPEWGAWGACYFWDSRGCGPVMRAGGSTCLRTATKKINGGVTGYDDREARYLRICRLFKVEPW